MADPGHALWGHSHGNPAAVNRSLTVEYTQNPKWLALQCLPSMVAPVCQDVLSLSAAYYAGSLAYHIAHTYPEHAGLKSKYKNAIQKYLLKAAFREQKYDIAYNLLKKQNPQLIQMI